MTSSNVARALPSKFDDVTVDVIIRNVGGLLGNVIPLNVPDRLYIIIEYIIKF